MKDSEIRERLSKVRCFLLDMDGTFYLGSRLLEGSLDFLDAVERTGRQVMYLTNNSSKSAGFYVEKLRRMGVREPFLKVLTSGQAACRYVMHEFPGKRAYLLGNRILKAELEGMGLAIDNERPDYVLIAYDTELDYQKMDEVCRFVRQGLPYIATHPDFNCPTEQGFAPDIGAIMAFIKASTGRLPDVVIGKPNAYIAGEAMRLTGLAAGELAMVGDRLYTDVETALRSGMCGVLVMSGETDADMLAAAERKPDLVFENLAGMIPYLS